ncbi:MAG: tetratricopeptide repeat protein [Spirochaetales bacterium]|nr:tetratricopeptide repeat protein [Spirochaetales bacterium]
MGIDPIKNNFTQTKDSIPSDNILGTEQEDLDRELTPEEKKVAEISELSKSGYQLLKENLVDDAVFAFKKILALDPDNNYALVGIGDGERKKGNFKEAIKYYKLCLESQPENNYALFGLADCYKALRQYSRAIAVWEKYLIHDNKNITVLTRVADAYRKIKDFRSSKAIYMKVLEMEPNNPYALIGLGHLHYDFKEFDVALEYWEKMLETNHERVDIRVLTSLGNCHRKLKTYQNGVKYFEMALDLDPKNFYALFGLADCYRGMDEHEKSLLYWEKILMNDPTNKVILTRIGDAYRNMNDLDKAERNYQAAINIEFDSYAVLGLALINKQRGKYEDAITSLRGLMRNDMKNHRLYTEIAECYIKLGDRHKAKEVLMDFQRLGIKNIFVSKMLEDL